MKDEIIDLVEVMERVQDDKELLLELFDIFTQDYEVKFKSLQRAVADKNFELIKELVHSIKGAAGNISAKAVHAACVNIERLAQDKDLTAIDQAVPVLDGHFKRLQVRMAEIKKQFGG